MWAIVLVAVVLVVVLIVALSKRSGGGAGAGLPLGPLDCFSLLQQGVPARGILLKVSSQRSAKGTIASGLYEVRSVTIDIEVPGKAPYQCDCSIYVPARLCRFVLPGATLELRVHPQDRRSIAVFGPGASVPADGAPAPS